MFLFSGLPVSGFSPKSYKLCACCKSSDVFLRSCILPLSARSLWLIFRLRVVLWALCAWKVHGSGGGVGETLQRSGGCVR